MADVTFNTARPLTRPQGPNNRGRAGLPAQPSKVETVRPQPARVPPGSVQAYNLSQPGIIQPASPELTLSVKINDELLNLFLEMKRLAGETAVDQNSPRGVLLEKYVANLCYKLKGYSKFVKMISAYEKQMGREKLQEALRKFIRANPSFQSELFELSNMPYMIKGHVEQLLSVGVLCSNYDSSPTAKTEMLKMIAGTLTSLGLASDPVQLYLQLKEIKSQIEEPNKNTPNGKRVADYFKKKGIDNVFDLTPKRTLELARTLFPDSIFSQFEKAKIQSGALLNYEDLIRSEIVSKRSPEEQKLMMSNFVKGLKALVYKMPYGAMRITTDGKLYSEKDNVPPGVSCISAVEVMVKILFGKPEMETNVETAYNLVTKSRDLKGHPVLHDLSVRKKDGGQEQFMKMLGRYGKFFVVQTYASERSRNAPVHAAIIFEMGGKWRVLESADAWQTVKANGLEWWLSTHENQTLTVIPLDTVLKNGGNGLKPKSIDPKFLETLRSTIKDAFANNGNRNRILEWMASRSRNKG